MRVDGIMHKHSTSFVENKNGSNQKKHYQINNPTIAFSGEPLGESIGKFVCKGMFVIIVGGILISTSKITAEIFGWSEKNEKEQMNKARLITTTEEFNKYKKEIENKAKKSSDPFKHNLKADLWKDVYSNAEKHIIDSYKEKMKANKYKSLIKGKKRI